MSYCRKQTERINQLEKVLVLFVERNQEFGSPTHFALPLARAEQLIAKPLKPQTLVEVSTLIGTHGLQAVLDAITEYCYQQGDANDLAHHEELADQWIMSGDLIDRAAQQIEV